MSATLAAQGFADYAGVIQRGQEGRFRTTSEDIENRESHDAIELVHERTAIYTTPFVVDRLLDRLQWPMLGGALLDPAAGDGAFLERALTRLDLAVDDVNGAKRVAGYEFHSASVLDARERIRAQLTTRGWSHNAAICASEVIVMRRDFLIDGPSGETYRTVATNPPFLRFARLPDYFKRLYRHFIRGHALGDLLHAFLDKICEVIPQDGLLGLIASDRFLFNSGAAPLRAELGRRVGIVHVARVDPSTSFYRPKSRRRGTPPRVHPVEVVLRADAIHSHPLTRLPICPDGLSSGPETDITLRDIAEVRIAPWLGPFGIFVISAGTAATLADADLVPAVDTDDVEPTTDRLRMPTRFAIRTTRSEEPRGCVGAHLRATTVGMPPRGRKTPYWMPPETITLNLDQPRLLIPRIAKRLRAVRLPAGLLPINHNLSVVAATNEFPLRMIEQVLLSPESQDWIARNAPRLEGGYLSITTTLLRRMPVPRTVLARLTNKKAA